jgi:cAMP-dependent protein kinase regulator
VSAEAYGIFNKRENFKPKNIPKSDETKKKIFKRISEAFMFNCLDQKELEIIVNAMEETSFK